MALNRIYGLKSLIGNTPLLAISFKYNQDTESNACSKRIFCETPNKLKV